MRVPRLICLLGIIGLSAGCSTVVSKAGLNAAVEVQIGNPYSGVRFNLKSWRCLPSVAEGYWIPTLRRLRDTDTHLFQLLDEKLLWYERRNVDHFLYGSGPSTRGQIRYAHRYALHALKKINGALGSILDKGSRFGRWTKWARSLIDTKNDRLGNLLEDR